MGEEDDGSGDDGDDYSASFGGPVGALVKYSHTYFLTAAFQNAEKEATDNGGGDGNYRGVLIEGAVKLNNISAISDDGNRQRHRNLTTTKTSTTSTNMASAAVAAAGGDLGPSVVVPTFSAVTLKPAVVGIEADFEMTTPTAAQSSSATDPHRRHRQHQDRGVSGSIILSSKNHLNSQSENGEEADYRQAGFTMVAPLAATSTSAAGLLLGSGGVHSPPSSSLSSSSSSSDHQLLSPAIITADSNDESFNGEHQAKNSEAVIAKVLITVDFFEIVCILATVGLWVYLVYRFYTAWRKYACVHQPPARFKNPVSIILAQQRLKAARVSVAELYHSISRRSRAATPTISTTNINEQQPPPNQVTPPQNLNRLNVTTIRHLHRNLTSSPYPKRPAATNTLSMKIPAARRIYSSANNSKTINNKQQEQDEEDDSSSSANDVVHDAILAAQRKYQEATTTTITTTVAVTAATSSASSSSSAAATGGR